MAVRSVDPAGLSRHVESCPLLMWSCPVRSHRCQTQSLVPSPPHSLTHSLSLARIFLSSICPPPSYLPSVPSLPAPLVVSSPVRRVHTPWVSTFSASERFSHFYLPGPRKQMVVFSRLFSSLSLCSPSLPLVLCFFPSSWHITDLNWQSTCLFCHSPPPLSNLKIWIIVSLINTVLLLFIPVIAFTWHFVTT